MMVTQGQRTTFLIAVLGFYQVTALGGPPPNALGNPGFEAAQDGRVSDWSIPEYWSGSVAPVADEGAAHSGKRSARLASAETRSRHWGRVLQSVRPRGLTGRRFRYSMWARGSGEFLLGCIEYRSPERHKPHYKYRWQATPVDLGDEWKEVVFEFAVPDPEVRSLAVVAEVRGEGSVAQLDDAALVRSQEPVEAIRARLDALFEAPSLPRQRHHKGKWQTYDLRPLIQSVSVHSEGEGTHVLEMRLQASPQGAGRPDEILDALGLSLTPYSVERTNLCFEFDK